MNAPEAPLLRVRDLRVMAIASVAKPILHGIDLEVHPASILALVGESGAGKSMLGLSLMRLLPHGLTVTGGAIELLDGDGAACDLLQLSDRDLCRVRGRRIGFVFQEPASALNPIQRIGTQIAAVARLHLRMGRSAAWDRAVELLRQMDIPEPQVCARRYPHQLSGGMQQRVMLAMAIAAEPDLVIADEPTSALDATVQTQILALLRRLRDAGRAVLLITHDWGVVAETADRVCVLEAGRVVETGAVAEVFAQPKAPATRRLLAAAQAMRAGATT